MTRIGTCDRPWSINVCRFAELRAPLEVPDFEPDIDDKDLAKDAELRSFSLFVYSVFAGFFFKLAAERLQNIRQGAFHNAGRFRCRSCIRDRTAEDINMQSHCSYDVRFGQRDCKTGYRTKKFRICACQWQQG